MFGKKQEDVSEGISEAQKLLMSNIPNYLGYKKKETRTISDKAFRKHLLDLLRQSADEMSKVHELLIHSQLLTTWGPAGLVMKTIDDLRRIVADTDYKKSTFFDIEDVEGPNGIDLSILYLLEIEILDTVVDLKEKISKVHSNLSEMMLETAEDDIQLLMNLVNGFQQRLNERNELIRAFEKMTL